MKTDTEEETTFIDKVTKPVETITKASQQVVDGVVMALDDTPLNQLERSRVADRCDYNNCCYCCSRCYSRVRWYLPNSISDRAVLLWNSYRTGFETKENDIRFCL